MSGYMIKNFEDIDNANSDPKIPVDARFARKRLESEHLDVTRLRYQPGVRLGIGHSHREQEEVYVVLSGSGQVKIDEDIHDLRPWDLIRVAPGTCAASPRRAPDVERSPTGGATAMSAVPQSLRWVRDAPPPQARARRGATAG